MGVALPTASVLESILPHRLVTRQYKRCGGHHQPYCQQPPSKCGCSPFQRRAGLRAAQGAACLWRAAVRQKPTLTLGGLPAMQGLQALRLQHHLLSFCSFEHRPSTWVRGLPMALGHPACRSSLPLLVSLAAFPYL